MDHLLTSTATLSRSLVTGNKTTYNVASTIACHIQPLSTGYGIGQMGRDGKEYRLYSAAEVKIGDRIVDENSQTYEVTGAQFLKFRGRSHYQVDLRST